MLSPELIKDEAKRKGIDLVDVSRHLSKKDLKFLCRDMLGMNLWDHCHDHLQDFLETSKKNKKLILLPREHLKSSIITVGTSIQYILNNTNVSILYASAIQSNAESFLLQTKSYLSNKSDLPKLFGRFESEKWNESEILINQRTVTQISKTISVAGADKAVTSQHYDVIYLDDIVNRQTVSTIDQMEKTKKFYSDCMDLLKKPDGILYVIGTRWNERDLYGWIMSNFKEEFDIFNLQATVNGKIDGQVIFPKKFSNALLRELLKMKGSYEFNCQYMNSITSPESRIFNPPCRKWGMDDVQFMRPAITFDPATSSNKDSCDAVVMVSGINASSQLCALAYTIFKQKDKTPFNMINRIFDYIVRFQVRDIVVETNGGQEVYVHLLNDEAKKRKVAVNIIEVHQHKSKESRILALQPHWERGDLLLKPGMIELEDQFDRFRVPINGNVDILDALAMRIQEEVPMSVSQATRRMDDESEGRFGWIGGAYIPPTMSRIDKGYQELVPVTGGII